MTSHTPEPYIVDITEQNINTVLQQSMTTPVLLDFWADWCQPCKSLAPLLVKLAKEYQGRFILAKVNTDDQPMIAQQLGVRSLPTLKLVVQGQLAGELTGVQPESELRKLLEPHLGKAQPVADEDPFLAQIARARRMGALDQACEALQAAIQEQPKRQDFRAAYADVLMDLPDYAAADAAIAAMDTGPDKARVSARLFLLRELQDAPGAEQIGQALQVNPDAPELLYHYALHAVLQGQAEAGMSRLLALLQANAGFKEGSPRKALLAVFDYLPKDDPLVSRYRRKLFALLH